MAGWAVKARRKFGIKTVGFLGTGAQLTPDQYGVFGFL